MKCDAFCSAGVSGERVSVRFKRGGETSAFLLWCQEQAPKGHFGELTVGWGVVSPPWLPCRKEDGFKGASLSSRLSEKWCHIATVHAAAAEIISQTKPDGETDEKGRERLSPVSSVLLTGRKPRDYGLSEEQKQLSPPHVKFTTLKIKTKEKYCRQNPK